MLKSLFNAIQEKAMPQVENINGDYYLVAPGNAHAVQIKRDIDAPARLTVNSLDSLVKMVRTEGVKFEAPLFINVPTPTKAVCFGKPAAACYNYRCEYYTAEENALPTFRDGYTEHDTAIIKLQSCFVPNEGTAYILDLLSRTSKDSNVTSKDNGVTQTIEARRGISMAYNMPINPRVKLRPYRTFMEIEQPESEFLLRVDEEGRIGLFEADGGMWKLAARRAIVGYLEEALAKEIKAGDVLVAL